MVDRDGGILHQEGWGKNLNKLGRRASQRHAQDQQQRGGTRSARGRSGKVSCASDLCAALPYTFTFDHEHCRNRGSSETGRRRACS